MTLDKKDLLHATEEVKLWTIYNEHDSVVNQKYNSTLPYSFHLRCVVGFAKKFKYLLLEEEFNNVIIGAAGHDLIEDARWTYNDCKEAFGEVVSEIIYTCTELRGKNRKERHGDEYLQGLIDNHLGLYVKLCDLMANISFSICTQSTMFNKYKQEFPVFKNKIGTSRYEDMFLYIDDLLQLN